MGKIIIVAVSALLLTGCSNSEHTNSINGTTRWSYIQELPDGRSVVCAGAIQAITCDWENAK